jgi:hypothetical protein
LAFIIDHHSLLALAFLFSPGDDLFGQTVIKSSFPYMDTFIRAPRDEVIAVPAKLGVVGVALNCVLQLSLLGIPNLCGSIVG